MAGSIFFLLYCRLSRRGNIHSLNAFLFIPTTLALITCLLILFYIVSTSKLFLNFPPHYHQLHIHLKHSAGSSSFSPPIGSTLYQATNISGFTSPKPLQTPKEVHFAMIGGGFGKNKSKKPLKARVGLKGRNMNKNNYEVFHDQDIFMESYKEMSGSLKIYIYPHRKDDPFANALLPVDFEPGGNYASESYFKKVLAKSHFVTRDPLEADLFFMPFSIARLRHDPRVGISGIQEFIRSYISNISHEYPFWNRSGGADHFYVACHSIGRIAIEKATDVKLNAIQVVCSSSYYVSAYVPHKDASLPQIWPRQGDPPNLIAYNRKKLAFFAGSINSPVREKLLQAWGNDSEISVYSGHLETPYAQELLDSKFCLHVKGFEVNTARIGDALYYGCVPVVIANHYDLPYVDILNWKSFSIVVATLDIPLLKKILQGTSLDEYQILQSNVLTVRKHFQWHLTPVDHDAFYMVMYELWLRRSSLKVALGIYV